MTAEIALLKVAFLTAVWSAIYAGTSYLKALSTPGQAEGWSWEKFGYTVLLAFVLGFGAGIYQVTPDEFWSMAKDSGYATVIVIVVENVAKAFARKMRGVPPEKPAPGAASAAPASKPDKTTNGGEGRSDDGDAAGEDPETIVADALKPLKPNV